MTNIILQHFTGELRELDKASIENIKAYAKMIGCEYEFVQGQVFRENLTSPIQKIYMLDEKWDDYDTVIMLDIDMFAPKGMTENVFDQPGIGLYEQVQKRLHKQLSETYPDLASIDTPYWGGAIYKMDRLTRQSLRLGLMGDESWMKNFNKPYYFEDEGIMHVLAYRSGLIFDHPYIDKKWCQCSFLPNPENAGFIHIRTKITPTGPKREKIENYQDLVNKGIL